MLEITDMTVRYRHFTLGPVSLDVPAGEFVALVGPNGSGTSTFIRAALGLRRPDDGASRWDGHVLGDRDPRLLTRIGYVSDSVADILEDFTAGEYWQYCRAAHESARGERLPEVTHRAHEYAWRLGFPIVAGMPLAAMSLGTRRKAQIVAALMTDPELLVLDDAFSGLDLLAARSLEEILVERTAAGTTILSANHDLDLVSRIAVRIAVLSDGQLVLDGTVDEVGGRDHLEASVFDALHRSREAPG
jgi:ABC-type multidrug transport system ATPase subunit